MTGELLVLTLSSAPISRALFYALVIPTTMPGAFFWKNKVFEEYVREDGFELLVASCELRVASCELRVASLDRP